MNFANNWCVSICFVPFHAFDGMSFQTKSPNGKTEKQPAKHTYISMQKNCRHALAKQKGNIMLLICIVGNVVVFSPCCQSSWNCQQQMCNCSLAYDWRCIKLPKCVQVHCTAFVIISVSKSQADIIYQIEFHNSLITAQDTSSLQTNMGPNENLQLSYFASVSLSSVCIHRTIW